MKVFVALILLSNLVVCWADSLPKNIANIKVVSINEVEKLVKDSQVCFVDVRSLLEYSEGHIPGAINIPLRDNRLDLNKLKHIQAPNLVIYCNGVECSRSHRAIKFLQQQSLSKKLFWFREGMAKWYTNFLWVRKGIAP